MSGNKWIFLFSFYLKHGKIVSEREPTKHERNAQKRKSAVTKEKWYDSSWLQLAVQKQLENSLEKNQHLINLFTIENKIMFNVWTNPIGFLSEVNFTIMTTYSHIMMVCYSESWTFFLCIFHEGFVSTLSHIFKDTHHKEWWENCPKNEK